MPFWWITCSVELHKMLPFLASCVLYRQPQVFDYPSIDAITQYITSIAPSALAKEEDEVIVSEEEEAAAVAALVPSRALAPRAAPAAGPEAAAVVVGVTALAQRTSSDAVLSLEGKDASRRLPFSRWEVDRQLQVRCCAINVYSPQHLHQAHYAIHSSVSAN
jgi:hypothetical protein